MSMLFKSNRHFIMLPGIFLGILLLSLQTVQAQKKTWVAPKSAASLQSPIANNDSTLSEGKLLYMTYCSPCHGTKGDGLGPSNAAMNPNPANHTAISMKNESDGTLYYKISEGKDPMPEYKTEFTENQRWELVQFIRTLPNTPKK